MSKRARLSQDEARRAGLMAWETPEGRRWLLKALNPNDVSVAAAGVPTLHSRNISILNWQGEYSINVPANITENVPTFDTVMFLYQHPLIFGMSASRPNGCIDMREVKGLFHITRATYPAQAATFRYTIAPSTDPGSPIAFSRCAQYLNNQVDPTLFGGDKSLAGKRKLFRQLTQRSRIAYGGATIIPTCSSENDSGSLAVCQQIFSPKRTIPSQDNGFAVNTFMTNDFPNTSDLVQNPQMYYGRFKDGAYIPYKLNDPSSNAYAGSEQEMTTRGPYFVSAVSFLGSRTANAGGHLGRIVEVFGEASAVNETNFTITTPDDKPLYNCIAIRLYLTSFTGQSGYITLSLGNVTRPDGQPMGVTSELYYTDDGVTKANLATHYTAAVLKEDAADISTTYVTEIELNDKYLKLPEYVTCWDWVGLPHIDGVNPIGSVYTSLDISSDVNAEAELRRGTIPPYNGNSLITVHMSGMSNTAPIKMLLRYGAEILLVASSAYSPFKFMSPKYDESAIKSYARCIRAMKDAYFANAGSVVGQADYTNKLMNLIENDSPEELNRTLNQGGGWSGVVGAY